MRDQSDEAKDLQMRLALGEYQDELTERRRRLARQIRREIHGRRSDDRAVDGQ
ncbi:MAG: hypothetical protein AAF547_01150 [Actinomycetota bacterium]